MAKKLGLSPLKIQSFVTNLDEKEKGKVKGGMTEWPICTLECTYSRPTECFTCTGICNSCITCDCTLGDCTEYTICDRPCIP